MSKTLLLTKVLIKSIYDTDTQKRKRKINLGPLGVVAIVLLLVASLSVPLFLLMKDVATSLATIQATPLIINVILPIASLVIMILSIFTIISVFFLSTDNAILLPLPLKPSQLLLARFFSSLFVTYLIELVILLPLFIGLGVGAALPIDFYFLTVIVIIGLPIIPVAIIGLIMTYVTRFTNMAKHKDLLTYISFFFILAISLGFNFAFSSMMTSIEFDPTSLVSALESLSVQLNGILTTLFPFMLPASTALTATSLVTRLLNALLYVGINGVALVLFAYFGGIMYHKTILGSGENPSKKKELSNDDFGKNTRHTSVLGSYIGVEWKLMARSPIYFMNLIIIIVLLPVILVASMVFSMAGTGANMDLSDIVALLGGSGGFQIANANSFLIGLAIMIFLCSVSMISSTSISRMGTNAYFVKYIPVQPFTQLRAKMFWGIASSIVLVLIMLGLFIYLDVMTLVDAIILFIPSIGVIYLLNYMGLFVDLKRPKLNWTTEASAVKSNLNSLIVMLASWALGGILIAAATLLNLNNLHNGGYYTAAITTIGSFALTYLFYRLYTKSCKDVFSSF